MPATQPHARKEAPRRRPLQERSRKRRDALLRAAAAVLRKEGYEAASTSRIARAARVPVGSLYEYFPNKEALFETLLAAEMERVVGSVQALAAAQPSGDARGTLRRLIGVAVKAVMENRETLGALLSQIPGVLESPALVRLEERIQSIARLVEWISAKPLPREEFALKLSMLTHAVFGFLIRLATSKPPASAEKITDELVKLVIGYLELPAEFAG